MDNMGFGSRVHRWLPSIGLSLMFCLATLAVTPSLESQSEGPLHAPPGRQLSEGVAADANVKPLRIDVNVVLVPVTVSDAMNHPITGLGKQNFVLSENDLQQEIQYFSTEDSPISIGLLVDLSKSMANKFDAERSAISEFFNNANSEDDYFVVTFSSHPDVLTDVTQSIGTIQSKLGSAIPSGSTAMLDAISMAMTRMHQAKYNRRALLIISDGGDNNSRHKYREIKSLVRDSDVQVYSIGLFDTAFFKTFEEFMGKKWLSDITDSTGGRTIAVDNIAKMPEAAGTISRALRSQYVLGYRPSKVASDGKRRQIKVRMINPSTTAVPLQAYYRRVYVIPQQK